MQEDFIRGALTVPGAEEIISPIEKLVKEYITADDAVLFTRDTHYEHSDTRGFSYAMTREGRNLPFFLSDDQLIFNFVYRSYLTRHGKGPVGDSIFKEINNPYETNLNNPFQGEFQTYEFNKELVLYGIDHVKSHFNPEYKVRLIETCCDICAGHDLGIPYNYSIKTCKKNFDSVCK